MPSFNGSSANNTITATGVAADVVVTGASSVEGGAGADTLVIKPLAGSDTVTVGDLSGTAVRTVNIDLSGATAGQADNAQDSVTVDGLAGNNQLSIALQTGGRALTAVDTAGGVSMTTNVTALDGKDQVTFSLGSGNDSVVMSGPVSKAHLFVEAGDGNDTVQAAAGNVVVDGDEGNDLLISADGAIMQGFEGDDTLTGAFNDVLQGGDGNDLLIAGDSTRAFGEAGDDTFIIPTGVNGAQLSGGDGNDVFQASEGNVELHGDAGDDTVVWTMNTPQTSNSLIDGGTGNDTFKVVATQDDHAATIELAKGDDGLEDVHVERDFDWPSDQNTDANLFAQDVEHIQIVSGRGADNIVVQDQTGLGVQQIDIDLGAAATGGPDGQRDTASILGTSDADHAAVTTVAGGIAISGLAAAVKVTDIDHSAGVTDKVQVEGGFGDDTIDVSTGADRAQLAALIVDGGDGSDTVNVVGTAVGEAYVVSNAGDGASVSVGGASLGEVVNVETLNIATRGGGDSVVVNNLEGTGVQTLNIDFSGATAGQPDNVADRVTFEDLAAGDQIYINQSADGHGLQAGMGQTTVNVANLDNQDQLIFHGNAGDDTIVADGAASLAHITLNGGAGDDFVVGGNGSDSLFGELGNDTLQGGSGRNGLDGGDGDDLIINGDGSIATGDAGNDTIQAAVNDVVSGGDGNDLIRLGSSTQATGGAGDDTFTATANAASGSLTDAGDGNDAFIGVSGNLVFNAGAGDDHMTWNMAGPQGDNVHFDGQDGDDTLTVNQAATTDSLRISAAVTATPGSITSDIKIDHGQLEAQVFSKNMEHVSLSGAQGADTITIGNMIGVHTLDIDLGSVAGAGDGRVDTLTLNAVTNPANITVSTVGGNLVVSGLPETVTVHNVDHGATTDAVTIVGSAGSDQFDFSALSDLQGVVTVDTGAGNDTVTGGQAGVTFAFHGGDGSQDVFNGFLGGGVDHIRVAGSTDHSLADLVANGHIAQSGADVVISDGAGTTLTLTGVNLGDLTASDFLFG